MHRRRGRPSNGSTSLKNILVYKFQKRCRNNYDECAYPAKNEVVVIFAGSAAIVPAQPAVSAEQGC
jgi:hypothetical protein